MISKKNLKSINRDRLIEAVALLSNSDYIRTQLNLLLDYSELTLTVGKNVLSKCLIAMGKWGEAHKDKEKFEGTLAGLLAPLRETGEKLDVKTVDLLQGFLKRHEEEKSRLASLSDEGLADMFLHSVSRIVRYNGDVSGDELSEQVTLAMMKLYGIKAPSGKYESLEEDVAAIFLREIVVSARSKLKIARLEESARACYQEILSSLSEAEMNEICSAYSVALPDFVSMKAALGVEKLDLSDVRGKGFGHYLGAAVMLEAYACASKTVYPMARAAHLVTVLTFILVPLFGFFVSTALFGIFEWFENENFNSRMVAYLAVPFYLESLPAHPKKSKPKPKALPAPKVKSKITKASDKASDTE